VLAAPSIRPAGRQSAAPAPSIAWPSGEGLEHRKELDRELAILGIDVLFDCVRV
jgi:hypothetical protein